jgi:hypothetical protein
MGVRLQIHGAPKAVILAAFVCGSVGGLAGPAALAQTPNLLTCRSAAPWGKELATVSLSPDGAISGFSWSVNLGRSGYCSFSAATFSVVGEGVYQAPNGCQVLSWRQGGTLTLAASPATSACQASCSSFAAYERLFPVLLRTDGKGCG